MLHGTFYSRLQIDRLSISKQLVEFSMHFSCANNCVALLPATKVASCTVCLSVIVIITYTHTCRLMADLSFHCPVHRVRCFTTTYWCLHMNENIDYFVFYHFPIMLQCKLTYRGSCSPSWVFKLLFLNYIPSSCTHSLCLLTVHNRMHFFQQLYNMPSLDSACYIFCMCLSVCTYRV